MKPLSKRITEELKSLALVTFRMEEVPAQWVPIHGRIVWRAIACRNNRKKVSSYGLKNDWYLAGLLGLKKVEDICGDFSFIRSIV